ncbi:MAG: type II toxin-antitoxin system PemK/MazF family toxin [Candidatus Woesearchaeota archaeon]
MDRYNLIVETESAKLVLPKHSLKYIILFIGNWQGRVSFLKCVLIRYILNIENLDFGEMNNAYVNLKLPAGDFRLTNTFGGCLFNNGPAELVFALPVTSSNKTNIPFHVKIEPPEGVNGTSFVKCDNLRSISTNRLKKRLGSVSEGTIKEIEHNLKILLGI